LKESTEKPFRYTAADFEALSSLEWLITNGIGGFASGTVSGANSRRYHGLLIGSLNPPTQRMMLVAKVEESVTVTGETIALSSNRFPDAVHPEGHRYLSYFERQPLPRWLYEANGATVSKSVWMVHGSNTTVVQYENCGTAEVGLKLEPMYAVRDYHGLVHETHDHKYFMRVHERRVDIYAYAGSPPVFTGFSSGAFTESRRWLKHVEYEIDKQRGQTHVEDLFATGYISCKLKPGDKCNLVFTTDEHLAGTDPEALKATELARLDLIRTLASGRGEFYADLVMSADQFVVRRRSTSKSTVIAGYHWFTDWGRDSMIALRGLCIATGRKEEAQSVILTFLQYLQNGIIPNRFPDYENDQPEYHTIDATLWLFIAVYEYDRVFSDDEFLSGVCPKLEEILNAHIRGTIHNIHVTVKGFLFGAADNLPLTWMDARAGEQVFTPRQGCPVEINVLWYNALKIYEYVRERLDGKADPRITSIADAVKQNFQTFFWNTEGYLNDVVRKNNDPDSSIRPNQIYAVSLPFSILTREQEKQVVEQVKHHLLTPYGLRTLSPGHPGFRSYYEGDLLSRDAAYHQGTVWPFLLSEYLTAYLKVNDRSVEAKREAERILQPLKAHFFQSECLHAISEIFDGLNPSAGKGCAHQAWSVAGLIWIMHSEGLNP
jgi:predicted glycogen debranching enzyme